MTRHSVHSTQWTLSTQCHSPYRHHQKKTGSETLPQNVWKRVSLRVISYLFLKEVTFHTPSRFFEHYLVLFHTSCRHTSYLLVFIPIMTRFHTTRYIHTYILVLHTYTTSYSLRLSFIPGRLFTLWTLHTYLLLLHTRHVSYNVSVFAYLLDVSYNASVCSYLLKFIHVPTQVHTITPLLTTEWVYHTHSYFIPIMAHFTPSAVMFHTVWGIQSYSGIACSYCRRE